VPRAGAQQELYIRSEATQWDNVVEEGRFDSYELLDLGYYYWLTSYAYVKVPVGATRSDAYVDYGGILTVADTWARVSGEEDVGAVADAWFADHALIIDHPGLTGQPGSFTAHFYVDGDLYAEGGADAAGGTTAGFEVTVEIRSVVTNLSGILTSGAGYIGDYVGYYSIEVDFVYGEPFYIGASLTSTTEGAVTADETFVADAYADMWFIWDGMSGLPEDAAVTQGVRDWISPASSPADKRSLVWTGSVDSNAFLAGNWDTNKVPDIDSSAVIHNGGTASVNASDSGGNPLETRSLTVIAGVAQVDAATLIVDGLLQVRGSDIPGELRVLDGGTVQCGRAQVGTGSDGFLGKVVMEGGTATDSVWRVNGALDVGRDATGESTGELVLMDERTRVEVGGTMTVSTGGCVYGSGTLAATNGVVLNGGTIEPGLSPGTLTIDGDLDQRADGVIVIEIGGPNPVDRDYLVVSGTATLGGKLVLRFINGFAPKTANAFDFLTASGGISNGLAETEIQGLAPGFTYEVSDAGGIISLTALGDGQAVSRTSLSIGHSADGVVVWWPTFVEGYKLQSVDAIGSTLWNDHSTVSNRLTVAGGGIPRAGFFRLVREE